MQQQITTNLHAKMFEANTNSIQVNESLGTTSERFIVTDSNSYTVIKYVNIFISKLNLNKTFKAHNMNKTI